MNDIRKIAFLIIGLFLATGAMAQVSKTSDSVAICEPGESAEVIEESVSKMMSAEEIAMATDSIMANYDSEWKALSMQGKLSFTGLPMRVSVKVYMERGESVILSARAPFLGEVARVEMNQDSIVFINKHSRTYNTQQLAGYTSDPKRYLCDLQDILLGEVAYPGNGHLTQTLATQSQWISMPGEKTLIHPSQQLQVDGTEYGFVMDSTCWQLERFVLMIKKPGVVVETQYLYGEKNWTLGLEITVNNKKMNGEVELSYPDYSPSPIEFTTLGNKYRKVDFQGLMKF